MLEIRRLRKKNMDCKCRGSNNHSSGRNRAAKVVAITTVTPRAKKVTAQLCHQNAKKTGVKDHSFETRHAATTQVIHGAR